MVSWGIAFCWTRDFSVFRPSCDSLPSSSWCPLARFGFGLDVHRLLAHEQATQKKKPLEAQVRVDLNKEKGVKIARNYYP
jgi:hypothetical protein